MLPGRVADRKIAYIVAPDGASGGGMGRIKDNIVQSPAGDWAGLEPVALITRNGRGRWHSAVLLVAACCRVLASRLDGSLALVHVNMGDRGSAFRKGLLVLFARGLGVPVFVHLHAVTLERDLAALPRWLRRIATLPFRAATCVIVLGERWRRWLHEEIGLRDTPVEVLVNGVPMLSAQPRHATADGPLRILFLGNLIERKGVSDLIAALALVPQSDRGWTAQFAGGGDIASYTTRAEAAGIAEHIGFVGWVGQETAQAMAGAADLLVLPSYDEGLPLVVIEAMGLGTPVIATPIGALPEVLTDRHDVVFCEPGDVAGLAATIAELLRDGDLRHALGDHGLETFDRCFSIQAFRRNLRAIWERYLPAR